MAKELGGKVQVGSGNQWHSKGDVKTRGWLIEAKRTDSKSYTLRLLDLAKIRLEAIETGKEPVMCIEFGTRKYAVCDWDDFVLMAKIGGEDG